MKIVSVSEANFDGRGMFAIERDDGFVMLQSKGPETASQRPLTHAEETLCALCARIIEMDQDLEEAYEEPS